ncbi:hypothetical protein ACFLUW_03045, partial [Chloroflexota bacterium]
IKSGFKNWSIPLTQDGCLPHAGIAIILAHSFISRKFSRVALGWQSRKREEMKSVRNEDYQVAGY